MTPYFQDACVTLFCGDALDVLPHLQPCGLLYIDPPYCSGGAFRGDRVVGDTNNKYQNSGTLKRYLQFSGDVRDQRQFCAFLSAILRAAPIVPGGIVACWTDWRQIAAVTDAFACAGLVFRGIAGWNKTNAVRPVLGRPRQQVEFIVWGTRGPRPPVGAVVDGCWSIYIPPAKRTLLVQKPVEIAMDFMRLLRPGETVVDCFSGSGTTMIAARRVGAQCVCVEVSEDICELSVARYRQECRPT